jgi:hypothetical protein
MSHTLMRLLSLTEVWVGALGLAAFLTLFWVLRGAPPGQAVAPEEDEDAPRGGYRDRVVAAVCVGMMLILAGGYLAATRGILWSMPAFALGFGTVLTLVAVNQRYRHGSPSLRRTVDLSTAALNAALFAGVLVVVNVIAFRYGGRALDLTREGSYSLSSQTVRQLEALSRPVTFTTFFGRSRLAAQQLDRVRQLLELYKAANPAMVRLEHVDPDLDLARYEALLQRAPEVKVTQGGGVVIEYGEEKTAERAVVRNADLFDIPRAPRFDPSVDRFESTFKGEDAITNALIRLHESKRPRVVFTTGHGEPSVEVIEGDRAGLGIWKSRLTATGVSVATVQLLTEEIPEDTSLVVIVGPKTPFRPEEAARLKAYSDRGKPLLLLIGETASSGLEALLRGLDVEVGKGLIIEPTNNYRGRVDSLLVGVTGQRHPILESLNGQVLFFYHAAPLKVLTGSQPNAPGSPVVATPLLRSSPQSWVETDLTASRVQRDPNDEAGPVPIGVAVNDRPRPGETELGTPRLVVLSSRNMADNPFLSDSTFAPANLDLLMNSVSWLRQTPENLGISPKTHVSLTLTAEPVVRARLILVPTVMAVLLIVTLGVATYLARRA